MPKKAETPEPDAKDLKPTTAEEDAAAEEALADDREALLTDDAEAKLQQAEEDLVVAGQTEKVIGEGEFVLTTNEGPGDGWKVCGAGPYDVFREVTSPDPTAVPEIQTAAENMPSKQLAQAVADSLNGVSSAPDPAAEKTEQMARNLEAMGFTTEEAERQAAGLVERHPEVVKDLLEPGTYVRSDLLHPASVGERISDPLADAVLEGLTRIAASLDRLTAELNNPGKL